MREVIKSILVLGVILPCVIGGWGCKGGKIPELGEIQGPASVGEYETVEFWVSLVNATGATFLWSCDPSDAGTFDSPDSPKTAFTASMATHDTPVKLTVTVSCRQFLPVILRKNITVRDVTKLSVGDIEGPDVVEEGSPATYSIFAADDTGIKYNWTAIPNDLGTFDAPQQPSTQFTASYIDADTSVEIQVSVESDNYGPVFKKKNITIVYKGPNGWACTWGGALEDVGYGVAIGGSNDVYVTGYFKDTVDFDPGAGVCEHTSNGEWDVFLSKFNSDGEFQWAHTWGGLYEDKGFGVATDGSGNAFVTGWFADTVDFNPGPGVDEHISNSDTFVTSDIFLSKFDSDGEFQWARTWGGIPSDVGWGVAVDGSGNPYTTGCFYDTADFDPGPGVDEHTPNGSYDIFLSKFDSNGEFQWARTWGGGFGYGVVTDESGNVYTTGYFYGTVDFNPGPGADEHTSNGNRDIFLSKFDSSGVFQWAHTWGGIARDYGIGVAVDCTGNVYNTGNGEGGSFLSKFDPAGVFQWSRTWGGDGCTGVAVDGSGNSYVTGVFSYTVDFDPGSGVDEHTSNGWGDIFLSKFNSEGDFQWARTWGGLPFDECSRIAVDGCSNAYITGDFCSIVDFDPGPGVDEHISNGSSDIFLCKFPPDGNW
jgi:hypothetical protein